MSIKIKTRLGEFTSEGLESPSTLKTEAGWYPSEGRGTGGQAWVPYPDSHSGSRELAFKNCSHTYMYTE